MVACGRCPDGIGRGIEAHRPRLWSLPGNAGSADVLLNSDRHTAVHGANDDMDFIQLNQALGLVEGHVQLALGVDPNGLHGATGHGPAYFVQLKFQRVLVDLHRTGEGPGEHAHDTDFNGLHGLHLGLSRRGFGVPVVTTSAGRQGQHAGHQRNKQKRKSSRQTCNHAPLQEPS